MTGKRYGEMTPEELGKAWDRQCRRHDFAVDCEEMNSPTIEDAAYQMRLIEAEFDRRGLKSYNFTLQD
jgi:hypothetical protein